MRQLRALALRLRGLFGRRYAEADFAAELESHIALHVEDGIRAGLSTEEARRQALIRLGGAEQTRQTYRERRTLPRLESLLRDMRHAVHQLRKTPSFTFTVVLTLALAIGANTAIFTLVHAILFRQLPFDDPSRVLSVENASIAGLNYEFGSANAVASFYTAAQSFKTIQDAAVYSSCGVNAGLGAGTAQRLRAAETSARFLDVLGVAPRLGRGFAADEDIPGKDHVALISDRFWRDALNADPAILGRVVNINGFAFTIIGILPPRMDFPANTDLWTPTIFDEHTALREGGAFFTSIIVRTRTGVAANAVRAEFNARVDANSEHNAGHNGGTAQDEKPTLTPIATELTKSIRSSLLLLSAAVLLVLLMACVNVASLALVKTAERRSEFAVRAALGAAPARLVQQQLVESTLTALSGGFLGVFLAYCAVQLLYVLRPAALADFQRPEIDPAVLAFTAVLALGSGIAFGLAPAWLAGREDPAGVLKNGASRTSARGTRFRQILVAGEIAIAFVLLTGAGLMLRTMANMDQVPLGYGIDGILSFSVSPHGVRYISKETTTPALSAFYSNVLDRLAGLPGVNAVAAVSNLPLDPRADMLLPVSASNESRKPVAAAPRFASGGYFGTMGIPLVAGRDFSKEDNRTSPRVVIVTSDLAEKLWPGQNPIGRTIRCYWYCKEPPTVIGVVDAHRSFGPRNNPLPEYYMPYMQQDWPFMTFVLRAKDNPTRLVSSVRRAVAAVDSAQPIYNIETMRERLDDNQSLARFLLFSLSVFAALAVLLAATGLYGVVSYTVTQRKREVGIRIAVGAPRAAILFAVLSESALIAAAGTALGLAASLILSRLLAAVLFGVTPHDPGTLSAVSLLFFVLATLASYLPARRAASIDPMQALRTE